MSTSNEDKQPVPPGTYIAGVRLDVITYEDFDTLLQALDALDAKHNSDGLVGLMMASMLSRSKEEANSKLEEYEKDRTTKQSEVRQLREAIAIVRAKLILARRNLDSQEASRAFEETAQ